MKCIKKNNKILKYQLNYLLGNLLISFLVIGVITCILCFTFNKSVLECRHYIKDRQQCKVTKTKPLIPNSKPTILHIDNLIKAEIKSERSTNDSRRYYISITNSVEEIVLRSYSNKKMTIDMKNKINSYLARQQQAPLLITVTAGELTERLLIISIFLLAGIFSLFFSPVLIEFELNKYENNIVVCKKYIGGIVKQEKKLLSKIQSIHKQKYYEGGKNRRIRYSIYFNTKRDTKFKIISGLRKQQAEQLVQEISLFLSELSHFK